MNFSFSFNIFLAFLHTKKVQIDFKSINICHLQLFFLIVTFHNKGTYPRTGMFCSLAMLITSWNLSMLSSIEQLIFFLLNVSDTDPNTATSVAPAAT